MFLRLTSQAGWNAAEAFEFGNKVHATSLGGYLVDAHDLRRALDFGRQVQGVKDNRYAGGRFVNLAGGFQTIHARHG